VLLGEKENHTKKVHLFHEICEYENFPATNKSLWGIMKYHISQPYLLMHLPLFDGVTAAISSIPTRELHNFLFDMENGKHLWIQTMFAKDKLVSLKCKFLYIRFINNIWNVVRYG
jgi:hypothetical protein